MLTSNIYFTLKIIFFKSEATVTQPHVLARS